MKNTRPVLCATAGLLALAGCDAPKTMSNMNTRSSSTAMETNSQRENPRTPPNVTPRTEAKPNMTASDGGIMSRSDIAFATDSRPPARGTVRTVAFSGDGSTPATAPNAAVGLYGEMNDGFPVPGNYDGSGNLVQITAASEGACFDPDSNHEGTMLALASTQHRRTADIYLKSTVGNTMTQITSDPAEDVMPAFSPDGQQVAFASNRDGNWNIYITGIQGGPPVQLTSDPEQELHPSWSADGQKLAFCKLGVQSGQWELWTIDLNSRRKQFLDYGLFPQWNPDPARNKITFQRARERGSRLFSVWTLDYVNGEAMRPTEIVSAANAAAMHPAWSPDGSRLVFITVIDPDNNPTDVPQQSDVWVVNIDGTSKTNLTKGQYCNLYPEWSAGGDIYFLSDRSGVDNIWSVGTSRTIEPGSTTPAGMATVTEESPQP
ncbi:MAG: hypothetical protein GY715_22265 [Planctomycetes bacterium]|nr:hypothetical protein [Planctomycetota bacterium]